MGSNPAGRATPIKPVPRETSRARNGTSGPGRGAESRAPRLPSARRGRAAAACLQRHARAQARATECARAPRPERAPPSPRSAGSARSCLLRSAIDTLGLRLAEGGRRTGNARSGRNLPHRSPRRRVSPASCQGARAASALTRERPSGRRAALSRPRAHRPRPRSPQQSCKPGPLPRDRLSAPRASRPPRA